MLSYIRTLFVCFFVSGFLSATAYAQDAQVQGQVLDASGAVIQTALVRVVDQKTGTEAKTQTNSKGQYTVPGLAAGVYKIFVQASGFSPAFSDQLTLAPGQNAVMDFTLKAGATSADVIVTAEKREERLQDVPVPVSVLNGDDLAQNNQTKTQDYLASVPGLSMSPGSAYAGGTMLEIRGIGTSQYQNSAAPTIGYLIDGVPYGPSEVLQFANGNPGFPEIDPSDIDRIEVLKGPQGTLYGSNSIGGLINVVTKDPSTEGVVGHIHVLGEGVPGGSAGYALRGSLNVPLSSNSAVRVSAFDRRDPGYIDDATTGQKNVNSAGVYGGHVSLLYKPLENLSFKLSGLVQQNDSHGISVINVDKDLQPQFSGLQMTGLPGTGNNIYFTQAYSGVITASLSGVKLVSTTGYNVQENRHNEDFTGSFGPSIDAPTSPFAGTAPNGSVFASNYATGKFAEEVRFSSSYRSWITWLVGGFYTHEATHGYSLITANNLTTGAYIGTFFTETSGDYGEPPTTLSEEATFGNLTAHLSSRFDIQFGGRYSWYQQAFNNMNFGPGWSAFGFGTPLPEITPAVKGSDSAFTWLITPEYKFSPNLMVYARFATGYEIGGTNDQGAPIHTFSPSKTTNYEIGSKGTVPAAKISYDFSAYDIEWKDIQIAEIIGSIGYVGNAGAARSQGIEASVQARPVNALRITAAGSYNDARLTTPFPADASVSVPAGTQLPYSMHWSGSMTPEWDLRHFGDTSTAFVGATVSYIGKHPGEFDGFDGFARLYFPSYTTLNTHIGLRRGTLEADLYAKNLTNDRYFIGGEGDFGGAVGNTGGYFAQVLQPRTIGFSFTKTF